MLEAKEISNKIVDFLRMRGPSLPIHVSKYLQMNSLFVSAFLSELTEDRKVVTSNMRVGGSPLYLLPGQEARLDTYHQHLHPKEVEAFLLLKKESIIKDADQDPAIRVALRAIKDFAIAFRVNQDIYWRYITVKESEINDLLNKKPILYEIKQGKKVEIIKEDPKEERKEIKQEDKAKEPERITMKYKREEPEKKIIIPKEKARTIKPKIKEEQTKFDNPLIQLEPEKEIIKKEKPKSEFVIKVINFLDNNNIKILEEKEYAAKEYNCITEINSDLGKISFLTQSKDKKSITDTDLTKLLITAQKMPLPALIIYHGKLNKKAIDYLNKYSSILKAKEMS